jgi:hypothetical protein
MAHKHANAMMEYAKDAAKTENPWERWQFRYHNDTEWQNLYGHPPWVGGCEYRRKPSQEQIDAEAFNNWWLEKWGFEKQFPSDAWTAALEWERSKK